MDTGLVLLGHGSRAEVDEANQVLLRLAGMVRGKTGFTLLETAFLNPRARRQNLAEAVEKVVRRGAKRIIVAPVFLSNGLHMQQNIPAEITRLKQKHQVEIRLAAHLGADPRIVEVIVDRIRSELIVPGSGLRVAGFYDSELGTRDSQLDDVGEVNFLTEPQAIEARSRVIIDRLIGDLPFPEKEIVRRIIHATGDAGLAACTEIHPDAVRAAGRVFTGGRKIIVDVQMVKAGIDSRKAEQLGLEIYCAIDDPAVVRKAREKRLTRAMVAINALAGLIPGNLVAVGNAPTALEELIRLTKSGEVRPALVIGTPVGFVGAAEAKKALTRLDVPYITVHGTRGGSAVAVSIVNALLDLHLRRGE